MAEAEAAEAQGSLAALSEADAAAVNEATRHLLEMQAALRRVALSAVLVPQPPAAAVSAARGAPSLPGRQRGLLAAARVLCPAWRLTLSAPCPQAKHCSDELDRIRAIARGEVTDGAKSARLLSHAPAPSPRPLTQSSPPPRLNLLVAYLPPPPGHPPRTRRSSSTRSPRTSRPPCPSTSSSSRTPRPARTRRRTSPRLPRPPRTRRRRRRPLRLRRRLLLLRRRHRRRRRPGRWPSPWRGRSGTSSARRRPRLRR